MTSADSLPDLSPSSRETVPELEFGSPQIPCCSAAELRDHVPERIDWIVEGVLAPGVFTILGGKPKVGKTTLLFGMVRAVLLGSDFMGRPSTKTNVLYVTEQTMTTIRPKLEEYGLLGRTDLHLMFPRQSMGLPWEMVVDRIGYQCKKHQIGLLIVDTVNDLCRLEDSFRDTEWIEALEPLQRLGERLDMSVCAGLHAKKDNSATLVDMFRGSNAIVGKADIVLGLWLDRGWRTLEGISRLECGLNERTRIVRQGLEYVTAGTVRDIEEETKRKRLLALLPTSSESAVGRKDIASRLGVKSVGTVSGWLGPLIADGSVTWRVREGQGSEKLYWAAPPVA